MTRRYADPIDVRRHDDAPAQFLWRGRLYVVRAVLAHWVETGPWWTAAGARALLGADGGFSDPGPVHVRETSAPVAPATAAAVGLLDDAGEREVWRVEASAGRAAGSGVYDLALDWSAGAWTLARTID